MGAEKRRERLRVRSSIDELPAASRENLEAMLADTSNGLSYRDMADILEDECGVRLSTSAIGRYAKRYMRDAKRFDEVMERWRRVADYVREHPAADASMYLNAMIQDGLMRRIMDGQDDIGDMDVADAIKLAIQTQRAAVYEYRYRDQRVVREEADGEAVAAERMEWLRGVLRDKRELLKHSGEALANDGEGGKETLPDGKVCPFGTGFDNSEGLGKSTVVRPAGDDGNGA